MPDDRDDYETVGACVFGDDNQAAPVVEAYRGHVIRIEPDADEIGTFFRWEIAAGGRPLLDDQLAEELDPQQILLDLRQRVDSALDGRDDWELYADEEPMRLKAMRRWHGRKADA